jgi:triphosphoribosyl-dephospho-CoA synthase
LLTKFAALQTPQPALAKTIEWACQIEVRAPKPGNVNRYGGGHGMQLEDFLRSAQAIAPVLNLKGEGIGERILAAVHATRARVPYNTNLGIILLFAPLARAALETDDLWIQRDTLAAVLARLDINDSRQTYQAIRLAQPGGMGHSPEHDLSEEPQVTLREAMQSAAGRDSIARQYSNGFQDVFEVGIPSLLEGLFKWKNIEWAATLTYLTFLTALPDSLVRRKYGTSMATKVARKASQLQKQLIKEGPGPRMEAKLKRWDQILKENFINPGTSADLTAATLLIAGLYPNQRLHELELLGGLNN